MEKTTNKPTTKRGMIDLLMRLNGNIGYNKAYIEDLRSQIVDYKCMAHATEDVDVKNYLTHRTWLLEGDLNDYRVKFEANLAKRAELQKQLAAKVVNVLDEKSDDINIEHFRWFARGSLKDTGVIGSGAVAYILKYGKHGVPDSANPYEVQLEVFLAPKMDAQIIKVSFHDIDDAVNSLKKLKVALGDMVILVHGHVSTNFYYNGEIPPADLISANDRLEDKIRELERDDYSESEN